MASRRSGVRAPSRGISTVRTTTARSSTSVIPIMIRPWRVWSSPRSRSSRASTMVLATEITMPTTAPWSAGHPSSVPDRDRQSPTVSAIPSGRAQDGHPLHAHQVLERELDPDREHQQDDSDLREDLEGVDVGDGRARRQRADEDPAHDVAEDERLAQQPGQHAAEHGSGEDVGKIPKERGVRHHGRAPAPGPAVAGSDAGRPTAGRRARAATRPRSPKPTPRGSARSSGRPRSHARYLWKLADHVKTFSHPRSDPRGQALPLPWGQTPGVRLCRCLGVRLPGSGFDVALCGEGSEYGAGVQSTVKERVRCDSTGRWC